MARPVSLSRPEIIEWTPPSPIPCDSYGDFDNDGWVTWYDVALLRSYVYGGWANVERTAERLGIALDIDEGEFVRRADLNGDGVVDKRDLWYLENYLNGYYTVPVCPKPKPRRTTKECLFPRVYMRRYTVFWLPRIQGLRYLYRGGLATIPECLFPRIYCLLHKEGEQQTQ